MTRIVEMALAHHETVHVKIVMGNHDDHSAVLMAEILEAFFRNEPRVIVDTSPNPYYYFTFGQNLFGVHHGNEIKPTDLPGIMAVDQAANWQADQHRYFLLGDKHHVEGKNEKGGVNWEIFPTIIPRDAWHHRKGYRSTRRMSAITYHRNFGEWERTVCPIDRIKYEINQRNKS